MPQLLNPNAPRTRGHPFCKNCGGQRPTLGFDGTYELCECGAHQAIKRPRAKRGSYGRR